MPQRLSWFQWCETGSGQILLSKHRLESVYNISILSQKINERLKMCRFTISLSLTHSGWDSAVKASRHRSDLIRPGALDFMDLDTKTLSECGAGRSLTRKTNLLSQICICDNWLLEQPEWLVDHKNVKNSYINKLLWMRLHSCLHLFCQQESAAFMFNMKKWLIEFNEEQIWLHSDINTASAIISGLKALKVKAVHMWNISLKKHEFEF